MGNRKRLFSANGVISLRNTAGPQCTSVSLFRDHHYGSIDTNQWKAKGEQIQISSAASFISHHNVPAAPRRYSAHCAQTLTSDLTSEPRRNLCSHCPDLGISYITVVCTQQYKGQSTNIISNSVLKVFWPQSAVRNEFTLWSTIHVCKCVCVHS